MSQNSRAYLAAENITHLTEIFQQLPQVQKYDVEGHQEAPTLAHAVNDITESCQKIIELSKPLASKNELEVQDILLSIGEELRHIIYHIKDSCFYKNLLS